MSHLGMWESGVLVLVCERGESVGRSSPVNPPPMVGEGVAMFHVKQLFFIG